MVLVEFWTYTCINWLRTMPWVRDSLRSPENYLGHERDRTFEIEFLGAGAEAFVFTFG